MAIGAILVFGRAEIAIAESAIAEIAIAEILAPSI
jgi:hypothetical protein